MFQLWQRTFVPLSFGRNASALSGVDRGGTGPAVLLVTWLVGCLWSPVRYVLGKAALFWEILSRAGRRLGFIFHSDTVVERMSLCSLSLCPE